MRRPPAPARFLLERVLHSIDCDAILGDLEEEYRRHILPERGSARAGIWYWRQALGTVTAACLDRMYALVNQPPGPVQEEEGKMARFWQDFCYGLRTIRKSWGFALVIVLTLALGIGLNTLVYSVMDGMVLNPFSYPEGDRLVGVGPVFPKLNQELGFWEVLSPAEYRDIETRSRTLEKVVAWDMGNRQVAGETNSENLFSAFWWGNAFDTLQVTPFLGRGFTTEETLSASGLAVISHRFWMRRFGGDRNAVGQVIEVNGSPATVIGVMPAKTLIYGTDLWLPMGVDPSRFPRGRRQFQVLARLAPGVDLEQANAELETLARQNEQAYGSEFKEYEGWKMMAQTWTSINTQMLRPAGLILMLTVGFVLLLVCANLASFSLARAVARRREVAVRTALGAGRGRIISQLLTESVVLAVLGGALGLGLAWLGTGVMASAIAVTPFPVPGEIAVNLRVLIFSGVLSLGAGLIFGLIPALQVSRVDVQQILQSESKGTTPGAGKLRLQSALVAVEVALAMILLIGGGLLVRSFLRMQAVEPGFDAESLLTMRLTLPNEKYRGGQITAFFDTLTERVESLPGVAKASATSQFPPFVFSRNRFWIEGEPIEAEGQLPTAFTTLVSEDYFQTLGIALLRGRTFNSHDLPDTPFVTVINEEAVRRFFVNQDPLGKRIKTGGPDSDTPLAEVIGIVRSTHNRGLETAPQAEIFASIRQAEGWNNQLFLMVRTSVPPRDVLGGIRREVAALDPNQPIYLIQTVEDAFAQSSMQRRVATTMLTIFAAFSLILAAVGIFSVVSYKVAARTQEIGLRLALGARNAQVRRMVARQALIPVGIGACAGLIAGLVMGNFMRGLLFEVSGSDPLTIGLVLIVLACVAILASHLPAWRATRMDPVSALRYE